MRWPWSIPTQERRKAIVSEKMYTFRWLSTNSWVSHILEVPILPQKMISTVAILFRSAWKSCAHSCCLTPNSCQDLFNAFQAWPAKPSKFFWVDVYLGVRIYGILATSKFPVAVEIIWDLIMWNNGREEFRTGSWL